MSLQGTEIFMALLDTRSYPDERSYIFPLFANSVNIIINITSSVFMASVCIEVVGSVGIVRYRIDLNEKL